MQQLLRRLAVYW